MMADEDLGDEVKVFRRDEDADDDPMISGETSEQQLADDKKEAVMEAELDGAGRVPLIGGLKAEVKAEPSPSFPIMPGMLPCGPYSPFSGLTPMLFPMVVPQYISPNVNMNMNMMNMIQMQAMSHHLSPSYAAAAMFHRSPFYPLAQAAVAKQHLENAVPLHMRPGPLSTLNHMKMNPYMPQQMMPQHNERRGHGGGKVKKEDHIKKPLNAFMWYMKENRPKLLEEVGNDQKQSAELNKELGKRWHDLPKEEQAKYFELAKKDRESHKEKYPQWSARENYAVNKKKPKRKRDKSVGSENNEQKKCRARFGVGNTTMWCKPCQRKKKCIYATDRAGSELTDTQDGRGTSGGCSSSSESPSPTIGAPVQHLMHQSAHANAMHAMIMSLSLGSASTHAPSPSSIVPSSSAGRSPQDTNPSDSESDIDDDEDIDPTITQQTTEAFMQESVCTI